MSITRSSFFFVSLTLTVAFMSCGDDRSSGTAVTDQLPQGMIMMDLSAYGKPFLLPVPDTAATPLSVTEEQDGSLSVRSGRSFAMSVYEQSADLKLKKDDLAADEVNKLKRMVSEDSTAMMWESAITEAEYHFVCNRKFKGSEYSFSDIPGSGIGEQGTKTMLESALHATEKGQ